MEQELGISAPAGFTDPAAAEGGTTPGSDDGLDPSSTAKLNRTRLRGWKNWGSRCRRSIPTSCWRDSFR
jgi:hypothetical protein